MVGAMPELIHTCYRVADLDRSIAFYEKLGMEEVGRIPIRDEAINVFMGLPGDGPRLELTYNIGRDEPYEIGTGYGHIAITVADIDATLERLASVGIEPERPPYSVREGGSRLCFVRDPGRLPDRAARGALVAYLGKTPNRLGSRHGSRGRAEAPVAGRPPRAADRYRPRDRGPRRRRGARLRPSRRARRGDPQPGLPLLPGRA